MVVESHKIAKTMFECAAECIAEVCNKQDPDPQQKKLYEKWKVGPQIKNTIWECVEQVTDIHTYIDEAEDSKDDVHDVAFVKAKECGKKLHQIHLYTNFFKQPSKIAALTLVHEMTHDNSNTVDVRRDPRDDYPKTVFEEISKKYGVELKDTQRFISHMMKTYPNEMKEALDSQEVAEECIKLDSAEKPPSNKLSTLLGTYKNVTPETAGSFWSTLTVGELDTSIMLNEIVPCKHISMDRACLLEFFPKEVAYDAECIARFAYDCYKYKQ